MSGTSRNWLLRSDGLAVATAEPDILVNGVQLEVTFTTAGVAVSSAAGIDGWTRTQGSQNTPQPRGV